MTIFIATTCRYHAVIKTTDIIEAEYIIFAIDIMNVAVTDTVDRYFIYNVERVYLRIIFFTNGEGFLVKLFEARYTPVTFAVS